MKKILALLTALSLLLCCAAFAEEEVAYQTGTYLITNTTGEAVTNITLTDPVTGVFNIFPNFEDEVLENGESVLFYFDIPAGEDGSHRLTLSYTTASGRTEAFETLSIEDVTINLLAADAMTGATPIAFGMPAKDQVGQYCLRNKTGEVITKLSITDNVAGTAVQVDFPDKFVQDEEFDLSFGVPADEENVTLTLAWETESGKTGSFETLKIETAIIELLDVDAVAGATQVAFVFE